MNRNVYGVILFSLIVGTAIFVGDYFSDTVMPNVSVSPTHCCDHHKKPKKPKRPKSTKIIQAVYYAETNSLRIQLPKDAISMKDKTMTLAIVGEIGNEQVDASVQAVDFRYVELDNDFRVFDAEIPLTFALGENENLYVAVIPGDGRDSRFDESNLENLELTPVLLDSERN